MSNKKRNPPELARPIHNIPSDSHRRAIELAKQHIDTKPIIYLLKR